MKECDHSSCKEGNPKDFRYKGTVTHLCYDHYKKRLIELFGSRRGVWLKLDAGNDAGVTRRDLSDWRDPEIRRFIEEYLLLTIV